ncbi:hypothetical protein D3C81_1389170 [compost metagenome]
MQLAQGQTVELVDGLALAIEIQFGDTVLERRNGDGFTLVNHRLISIYGSVNLHIRPGLRTRHAIRQG